MSKYEVRIIISETHHVRLSSLNFFAGPKYLFLKYCHLP